MILDTLFELSTELLVSYQEVIENLFKYPFGLIRKDKLLILLFSHPTHPGLELRDLRKVQDKPGKSFQVLQGIVFPQEGSSLHHRELWKHGLVRNLHRCFFHVLPRCVQQDH